MKKEIKFRGFNCGWYYGDLEYNKRDNVARIHTYKTDGSYDGQYLVAPDTIGQFTGLYDKNGVEIYEGDVVKTQFNKGSLGWVIWHEDGYFCVCTSKERYEYRESFTPIGELIHRHINGKKIEIEVIGNIYFNKDLL